MATEERIVQRLSDDSKARRTRAAYVRAGQFLRGPVPMWWLNKASSLPGKALAVGVLLWFKAGLGGRDEVTLTRALLERAGVGRKALYSALISLSAARLITVNRRRGRRAVIALRKDWVGVGMGLSKQPPKSSWH
jgi:hypothetical protein